MGLPLDLKADTMETSCCQEITEFADSIDDILASALLPIELKCRTRSFIFKISDSKSQLRMPRAQLEKVIQGVVMNQQLFPENYSLTVQGVSNRKRYLLSFVGHDSVQNFGRMRVLETSGQRIFGLKSNLDIDLFKLRLMVESHGGQFQLKDKAGQAVSVTIVLPKA